MNEYETISSETVFQGKVFDVRLDRIAPPSGAAARVDMVVHPGAVAMLPIDDEGRMHFVRQYRHPIGRVLLEIPAGTLEPGEDPRSCAVRECEEEIGYSPGKLTLLGQIYLAPGYSSEQIHLFLARDLRSKKRPADADEDLQVEVLSHAQVQSLLQEDQIQDAKTLIALSKVEKLFGA
jgi:ADP-ribose pyrophosphatase